MGLLIILVEEVLIIVDLLPTLLLDFLIKDEDLP